MSPKGLTEQSLPDFAQEHTGTRTRSPRAAICPTSPENPSPASPEQSHPIWAGTNFRTGEPGALGSFAVTRFPTRHA
ncbi:hypothetical protein EVAR_78856_1 [Eumeta japonica]|uniref:Uncharacterized protein n=1 Tax=Eumeta variegata TaxID=151549 RepID=A0A4C1U2J5_EUMVA|nr:hypothetical protein EVAR_78856_1 [Eumeta japonica]